MTLDDILGRCRIEDEHRIWAGAYSRGVPRIWAPDYTKGGKMTSQPGPRAVWHVKTGQPIPEGFRVFRTCDRRGCLSCIECMPSAERGREVAASGALKGMASRVLGARKSSRKRSKLNPELISYIKTSPKTGIAIAAETGLSKTTVSKVRKHGCPAFEPVGGLFSGLLAAAA